MLSLIQELRIPKIVHWFWDINLPTPDCVTRWPAILGDAWKIKMWEPKDVAHPQKDWLIENKAWATLADVARLQALTRYGGVYLDTDIELMKMPESLLAKAWIGLEGATTLCNAAMGANHRNEFMHAAWDRIQIADLKAIVECGACNLAGPVLISELWEDCFGKWPASALEHGHEEATIRILPKRTFYPFSWNEPPCAPHPDSCGVHKWMGRWKKDHENNQPTHANQ